MKPFQLGAHVPWGQIHTLLNKVLEMGLVPEIAIKGPELDTLDKENLHLIAESLEASGVRPRIHAPFFDLNPGALDPLIREVTCRRLQQTIHFAGQLNACLVIIHPGVDKWRYPRLFHSWLEFASKSLPSLVALAAQKNSLLAIENIYEESPDILVELVNGIDSPHFGHCFDAGHWHLFGRRPMAEWLEAIEKKLFHLHLHDNHGQADEHLPVGEGTIDFSPLQEHLNTSKSLPSITLEAHTPEHLRRSLQQVSNLFLK